MSTASISAILELPVQDCIRFVRLIAASVAADPDSVQILPALDVDQDARLTGFEENPKAGFARDGVKVRLENGLVEVECLAHALVSARLSATIRGYVNG